MEHSAQNDELIQQNVNSTELKGIPKNSQNELENEPNLDVEVVDSNHINNNIIEHENKVDEQTKYANNEENYEKEFENGDNSTTSLHLLRELICYTKEEFEKFRKEEEEERKKKEEEEERKRKEEEERRRQEEEEERRRQVEEERKKREEEEEEERKKLEEEERKKKEEEEEEKREQEEEEKNENNKKSNEILEEEKKEAGNDNNLNLKAKKIKIKKKKSSYGYKRKSSLPPIKNRNNKNNDAIPYKKIMEAKNKNNSIGIHSLIPTDNEELIVEIYHFKNEITQKIREINELKSKFGLLEADNMTNKLLMEKLLYKNNEEKNDNQTNEKKENKDNKDNKNNKNNKDNKDNGDNEDYGDIEDNEKEIKEKEKEMEKGKDKEKGKEKEKGKQNKKNHKSDLKDSKDSKDSSKKIELLKNEIKHYDKVISENEKSISELEKKEIINKYIILKQANESKMKVLDDLYKSCNELSYHLPYIPSKSIYTHISFFE